LTKRLSEGRVRIFSKNPYLVYLQNEKCYVKLSIVFTAENFCDYEE